MQLIAGYITYVFYTQGNFRFDLNDYKNIGKNKEIESNDIITLKQAYEAFKLYNKFQKIKQRAEEVDSEYIQNFLCCYFGLCL